LSLTLFWELPAAADGRSIGQEAYVWVHGGSKGAEQLAMLPDVEARRGGELVVQQLPGPLTVPGPSLDVTVRLLDETGAAIPTTDGARTATVLSRPAANP